MVIAGATEHHSVIAYSNALALNQISLETKIPIINGVIVTATDKEAERALWSKDQSRERICSSCLGNGRIQKQMDSEKPVKKPSSRRANRMACIQFLYQWEVNKPEELLDSLRIFLEDQEEGRDYYTFAESLILGVMNTSII